MDSTEGEFMMADWLAELEKQGWEFIECPACESLMLVSPDKALSTCTGCGDPMWAVSVYEKSRAW